MQTFYQWTPTTAMTTYLLTCTHDCLTALCPGHLPTQLISEKLTDAGSGPEKCPKVSEMTGLHNGLKWWLVSNATNVGISDKVVPTNVHDSS